MLHKTAAVKGCNDLLSRYARRSKKSYKWVVRTRFDEVLLSQHAGLVFHAEKMVSLDTLEYRTDTIYVPNLYNWGGVNDRFAIGSPEVMQVYANAHNYQYAKHDCRVLPTAPERFLKCVLCIAGITIREVSLPAMLVRNDGRLQVLGEGAGGLSSPRKQHTYPGGAIGSIPNDCTSYIRGNRAKAKKQAQKARIRLRRRKRKE